MTDENIETDRRPGINASNQNVPEIAEEAWAALILANKTFITFIRKRREIESKNPNNK